ncbi:hypothetical protein HAX54_031423 [Datura stramonium]|uniref:Dehydrin n=1 Tax=Datura stramonium TaxID=4076 RepID=A0ABS8V987_DATST|nr:hypothetical protein [Datura stramonium]
MAHNGSSQGQMHLTDEHGHRVHDQMEGNATQGTAMGFAPVGTATHHDEKEGQQQLRRSGSSSSSSSDDDGEGGRRKKKKGIKEKIKETLTGGADDDNNKKLTDQQQPAQTTPTGEAEEGEKKGMMEKIKVKIPGMH